MKPELSNILDAVLSVLGIERKDWELNHRSRQIEMVKVKELFCLLAYNYGYKYSEIGKFIHHHRATVMYHISSFQSHCEIYPRCKGLVEEAKATIESIIVRHAWVARCSSGLLITSKEEPEKMGGYWIATDAKPFYPQDAFPKVTYQSGPRKIIIRIKLEEDEEV